MLPPWPYSANVDGRNCIGPCAPALLAYNDDQRYAKAVEDYAGVLLADPAAFDGYYQWPVVYETSTGTYVLPEGYPAQPAVRQAG